MASLTADAIVCAVRAHGEHGAILRALTQEAGLVAGYVRGGRSRRPHAPLFAAGTERRWSLINNESAVASGRDEERERG